MKCPVCGSQNPDSSETCSVCGYDLTPYPSVLGEIPEAFLQKEQRRVAAAKQVWEKSQAQVAAAEQRCEQAQAQVAAAEQRCEQAQAQVAAAEAKQAELEDRLDEVSRNIEALTSSEVNWFEKLNLSKLYKQLPSGFRSAKTSYLASKSNVQKLISINKSTNRSKLNLTSNRSDISYYKLEELLFLGNWGKADIETANLMWKLMNREQEKWLSNQDIINFPCRDLIIIDRLWKYHSQSRFGFTAQREIWEKYGSPQELNEAWLLFCEKLGWKKSNQWFNLSDIYHEESPSLGLLPCCVFSGLGFGGMVWLATGANLFSRLTACQNLHNQNLDSPPLGDFQ